MIDPQMRQAIYRLHEAGMGLRAISRQLGVSRQTVRKIVAENGQMPSVVRGDRIEIDEELLARLFAECNGFRQRVYERLVEQEGVDIKYSTLTRKLRALGLGVPRRERCDRVSDEPGGEMQHDTSPFTVRLDDEATKLQASVLYLRYSKRRYLKFYRGFNRFQMKCFFHEALSFWGYCAAVCIIDNTNLARLRGSGRDAVIVPEMEVFARRYGFRFQCHEIGHANRKAGNERSFYTVETNFFAGRSFTSLEDLNEQAFQWATERIENRPVGKSRVIPAKAFEHEVNYLSKLPPGLPAPYLVLTRAIDQYGYVMLDGNFYWIPGEVRGEIQVIRYSDHMEVYQRRERLVEYPLALDGVKNECFSPAGLPKPRCAPKSRKRRSAAEERKLRELDEVIGRYLDFALKEKGPQERHRFVEELLRLSQQMTRARLVRALERALKYGITTVQTIRAIVELQLREDCEVLPFVEVNEELEEREAYLEGYLSDAPDFSAYEDMLQKEVDDGKGEDKDEESDRGDEDNGSEDGENDGDNDLNQAR